MSAFDVARPNGYGTIVVVGGGCYGSYYVRQLRRAAHAGALSAHAVIVVDRDPQCAVAKAIAGESQAPGIPPVCVAVCDWAEYFADYLARAAADHESAHTDAIVPSPLMPHLMGEWLVGRARLAEHATAPSRTATARSRGWLSANSRVRFPRRLDFERN